MGGTYEKTHPWLKFTLDMRKADPEFWMSLGEAQSKCEHIANVPLKPATAEKLHQVYLAKGALGTTAIEGNTLTEKEVLERIEGKLQLPPSKEYLGQEIDNVVEACNSLAGELFQGASVDICVDDIKGYNKLILKNLPSEEGVVPGEIRTYPVGVGRYRGAPPEDCVYLLERLCEWLNSSLFKEPKKELRVSFGILKSIIAHLYFTWIHPFGDGNGRTARMIEFRILITSGVPSAAAHLLSNHYNLTRREYYLKLDEASKSPDGEFPFIKYALRGFIDNLKSQLEEVKSQQLDVTWENYLHDILRGNSPAIERRRHFVLDISEKNGVVPTSEILKVSPRVAAEYSKKTHKTLLRDLRELYALDLIELTKEGIRAKKEKIRAFLPRRVSN